MQKFYTAAIPCVIFLVTTGCSKSNLGESFKMSANNETKQTFAFNGNGLSYANGQAALFLSHLNGEVQHFSFHIEKDAEGNVTGSWESKSPSQGLRTHGRLNCITFIDNHTAYMTGVVTQKVGEVFPGEYEVGMPVWFKVRDN